MARSLYIHIPFCSQICSYCDFKRIKTNNREMMSKYVDNIINVLKNKKIPQKSLNTIYLGGGTPNYLDNDLLDKLLLFLSNYVHDNSEFTIECNPEFINYDQVIIFKKNNVNRISLGVQTLNQNILQDMKRTHNNSHVYNAIRLLYKHEINNVSCDFIYNYKNMNLTDLKNIFNFIKEYNIKHVSFYALELKENSILNKTNYNINETNEEIQLEYIKKQFKKMNYQRYEISNWSLSKKYQSKHNLVYWNFEDWIGVGYGAFGLENNNYYQYKNDIINPIINENIYSVNELDKLKLMMGLRLNVGFDLNQEKNNQIFKKYKQCLQNYYIDDKNHLRPKNIDCLFDTIINLFN